MAKSDKQKPKGKKPANLKDLPPKPKGGDAVKGGLELENTLISNFKAPLQAPPGTPGFGYDLKIAKNS